MCSLIYEILSQVRLMKLSVNKLYFLWVILLHTQLVSAVLAITVLQTVAVAAMIYPSVGCSVHYGVGQGLISDAWAMALCPTNLR